MTDRQEREAYPSTIKRDALHRSISFSFQEHLMLSFDHSSCFQFLDGCDQVDFVLDHRIDILIGEAAFLSYILLERFPMTTSLFFRSRTTFSMVKLLMAFFLDMRRPAPWEQEKKLSGLPLPWTI